MSPQWLAVKVRLQGGLIPALGDSFFCRPASEAEPGFMTDGHIRVRRGRRHDQGRESRLPRRFAPQRRINPSSRASFAWRSAFIFVDYQNCRLPRPLHKCVLTSSTVSGLAVTDQQSSRVSVLIMLVIMILIITIKKFLLISCLPTYLCFQKICLTVRFSIAGTFQCIPRADPRLANPIFLRNLYMTEMLPH